MRIGQLANKRVEITLWCSFLIGLLLIFPFSGEFDADSMISYLNTNQDSHTTGLLLSHEGDPLLNNYGFTYDQALSIIQFIRCGNCDRANRTIGTLFSASKDSNSLYYSAYRLDTAASIEYQVTVGVNAWVALSFSQFYYLCGKEEWILNASMAIADVIAELYMNSTSGCIRGGPSYTWYSTEHNIDMHALFTVLYSLTGLLKYQIWRNDVVSCLDNVMWNPSLGRYNRGYEDTIFATDTTSWGILNLGAGHFGSISDFIGETDIVSLNSVSVGYKEDIIVTGYDFTDPDSTGRVPLVSGEFGAQMCSALRTIDAAGAALSFEYDQCIANLTLLTQNSTLFNGIGIPYSTLPNANTGHGFNTPNTTLPSIASTIWYLFARNCTNPFKLMGSNMTCDHGASSSSDVVLVSRYSLLLAISLPILLYLDLLS